MKTKVMMAAFMVACAFAMSSCGNKKAAASAEAVDSVAVEQPAACCGACASDSCSADSTKCCKGSEEKKACEGNGSCCSDEK